MPRILDPSFVRFPDVPEFVTQYIQNQELDEGEGVPGKTLIRVCLRRFCSEAEFEDRPSMENAKDDVVRSFKRMIAEGALLLLRREDRRPLFRLPVDALCESRVTVEQRDR